MISADLGAYHILAKLGEGGMGEVYRARDPRLDREVAIKALPASLAADAAALARFEREAMSIARLSHPNILAIHEFGRHEGTAFVVTELVTGDTLRARLERGPLPARRAVAYAVQIAHGMAAAHARSIIHRDLKPDNVMITADDHVRILDFGLAKPIDLAETDMTRGAGAATSAGTVLGTFGYMAPEQVRGQTLDHRADISPSARCASVSSGAVSRKPLMAGFDPAWSPDGKQIALRRRRSSTERHARATARCSWWTSPAARRGN